MPDKEFMRKALSLAEKGKGKTSPNPMVGSVLVKGGKIISEGWHQRAGAPHAEAIALEKAGKNARGGTLYITLEPCCHTEKRTPPCTRAIINSGVKKVVVAMTDPNPKVCGKGLLELEKAGIRTVSGVFEDKAKELNEAYTKFIKTRMPFVTMKVAMSLDGKIATKTGDSRWITGEKARKLVHKMRSESDAILTAVGTVRADDPQMTARIKGGKSPVRVLIDPELESPVNSKIFNTPPRTIIISRKHLPGNLGVKGVEAIIYKGELSLKWLMRTLGEMEIMSVMIEGGSSLTAHALEEGIVDKIAFFIAPVIIGGKEAYPAIGGRGVEKIKDAFKVKELKIKKIDPDFLLEGRIG